MKSEVPRRHVVLGRLLVSLVGVLALIAAACGSSTDTVDTETEPTEAASPEPTASTEPEPTLTPTAPADDREANESEAEDDAGDAPANDLLANAIAIDPAALPFTDSVDTTTATSDTDDEDLGCPAPLIDASVWYSITPTTDVTLSVSGAGSDFPYGISAAVGGPGSLVLLECRPFEFVVEAAAGSTYYFQVFDGDDPSSTGGNLTFTVDAPEPISTEGLAPLGQEFVDAATSAITVTDGAILFAVVDADGQAVAGSSGVDSDGNAPTASDVFRIGSITKVFTALTTLTLVDEGVVDLDAPASNYVSRVPVPADVTVRDLLQHTSGIFNYTDGPGFFDTMFDAPGRTWTPEEVVELVGGEPSLFDPGSTFSYSNTNYVILGVLIEEVTGRPYHEAVRQRLLEPLAMTSTYLAGFETGPAVFDPYEHEGESDFDYTSIATAAWSAGAMVSSAGDLHTLFAALFDDQIIPPDLATEMLEGTQYGLGIELSDSTEDLYGHSGGIPGYGSFVRHSPGVGTTAFLVSTDSTSNPQPAIDKMYEGFEALAAE